MSIERAAVINGSLLNQVTSGARLVDDTTGQFASSGGVVYVRVDARIATGAPGDSGYLHVRVDGVTRRKIPLRTGQTMVWHPVATLARVQGLPAGSHEVSLVLEGESGKVLITGDEACPVQIVVTEDTQ